MRMTYSHIFGIRLKSIKFDEKMINIVIVTIFFIRIFQDFVLFAYYQILFAFLCAYLNIFTRIKVTSLLIKQYLLYLLLSSIHTNIRVYRWYWYSLACINLCTTYSCIPAGGQKSQSSNQEAVQVNKDFNYSRSELFINFVDFWKRFSQ